MKAAHLSHNRELFKNTVLEAVNSGPQNQVFYPQLHVKHNDWISLNVQLLFCQFYGDFWYMSTVIFRYTHHTDISDTSSPKSKINGIINFGHYSGFRMCGRFLVIVFLYSPFLPHTHDSECVVDFQSLSFSTVNSSPTLMKRLKDTFVNY